MSSTYYPQAALTGFARGLEKTLCVSVDFTMGQPRTDGFTVYLPEITGALDLDGFRAMCGIAIHECSHVFFGSVQRAAAYNPERCPLKQACVNAVLDVADETRIEFVIPNAQELLGYSNRAAQAKIIKSGSINGPDRTWAVLAAGIIFTRLGGVELYKDVKKNQHPDFKLMLQAFGILKGCKQRKLPSRFPKPGRHRTNAAWGKLFKAADDLVELLKNAGLQPPKHEDFGPAGSGAEDLAANPSAPAGARLAGAADGEAMATGTTTGTAGTTAVAGGSGGGGSGSGAPEGAYNFDGPYYGQIAPSVAGAVARLAKSDDGGMDDGYTSGPRIGGDIERALIDGRCFARRVAEGERLTVAVVLDRSGSIGSGGCPPMSTCAALAQAFVDGVSKVAEAVYSASFDHEIEPSKNFRNLYPRGGTATDKALRWAGEQLATARGRRVVVCITDGEPNSPRDCAIECRKLISRGVSVIAVAMARSERGVQMSMPGAEVLPAADKLGVALKLNRIAAKIAR